MCRTQSREPSFDSLCGETCCVCDLCYPAEAYPYPYRGVTNRMLTAYIKVRVETLADYI